MLTSSSICCAHSRQSGKDAYQVLDCVAKHGVRDSMESLLTVVVSRRSLKLGDSLSPNTFYRLC